MYALYIISGLGVMAMIAEIFNFKKILPMLVLAGLLLTIGSVCYEWNHSYTKNALFNNMLEFNKIGLAFTASMCFVVLLWFMMAGKYLNEETPVTDHYALILFSLAGAIIMTAFSNLTMLFLGIEILSIPLYVLAGSRKTDIFSNEAAMKYFMMGAFASGFLLFGIALTYGATGSFNIVQISDYVTAHFEDPMPAFFYAGVILLIIGLAFKISAVPFHFWAPDVYQGSPNVVTAFMSTIVKTAAFAAFYRLFSSCFGMMDETWGMLLWVLAAVTLLLGNITAVSQTSFKRMLAYSSIAHAGYLLLAILSLGNYSATAILFYTLAYSIATISAFTVLNYVAKGNDDSLDNFNGLMKRNPLLAFALTVAMLSLAGIPPTAGFFAKYSVFTAAIFKGYTWLVIIAVVASLIGVYYYFKVIIASYCKESNEPAIEVSTTHKIVLIITTLITILLGVLPNYILNLFS